MKGSGKRFTPGPGKRYLRRLTVIKKSRAQFSGGYQVLREGISERVRPERESSDLIDTR